MHLLANSPIRHVHRYECRRLPFQNIIRMKEAFHDVDNDIYYVIMDKMEGSVADLIQHNRGHLTEEHALVVLRCTAKALDYLHK